METAYAGNAIGAPGVADSRPLETLSAVIDDLARTNEALLTFLVRFNGPQPVQGGKSTEPSPPPCYRSELERLQRTVREAGSLVDLITRLG